MSYVSRDELCDTIDENLRPLNNALDKIQEQMDRDLEALELRVERSLSAHKTKVVPLPDPANTVRPKEFAQLQDDFDSLQEATLNLIKSMRRLKATVQELYEMVELLSEDIPDA